jgi:hypothetical protein
MSKLGVSAAAWARDVGKWWWATVVFGLSAVALVVTVRQLRHHWELLLACGIALLLAGSFWAYHQLRVRIEVDGVPPTDTRRAAAVKRLTELIREGQRVLELKDEHELYDASWTFAQTGYSFLYEAIGPPFDADFRNSPTPRSANTAVATAKGAMLFKQGVRRRMEILGMLHQQIETIKILEDWQP